MKFKHFIGLLLYYGIGYHLPDSIFPVFGKTSGKFRAFCCRMIFKKCGKNITIERKAKFGKGNKIEIGNNSGIGTNASIPSNLIIGDNVMMGPNVVIFSRNHEFADIQTPMCMQGYKDSKQTIIEDDVWIGQSVIMTPGRKILKGTIIGAGTVLTKDFPCYSIIGGNPGKLLKSRI